MVYLITEVGPPSAIRMPNDRCFAGLELIEMLCHGQVTRSNM